MFQSHFPALFKESSAWPGITRERADSLRMIVTAALGEDASYDDAIEFVNRYPDIMSLTTIHPSMDLAMRELCEHEGWPTPTTFTLNPVSSYATLIHWRCLCILICNCLTVEQRREFRKYGRVSTSSCNEELSSEEMVVLDECGASETEVENHSETEVENQSDVNNNDLDPDLPEAYDSHFHLDRTSCKLFGRDTAYVEVEQLLEHSSGKPEYPVNVVGGVCVFSEPSRQPNISNAPLNWKAAVGAHPKHVEELTPARFNTLKSLVRSPDVCALGEIGLDRTVPVKEWRNQDLVFERILSGIAVPDKPIILHLRGQDKYGADVHARALGILRRKCSRTQRLHIHCFTGTADMVQDWLEEFPHAYFGFTAIVRSFDTEQVDALKAVPSNRLLLETDSPYMPVSGQNVNTPAFIGDVATIIARTINVEVLDILARSVRNGQSLYGQ